jgi:hypothetical protein
MTPNTCDTTSNTTTTDTNLENVQGRRIVNENEVNSDDDDDTNISHERKFQQPEEASNGNNHDKESILPTRDARMKKRAKKATTDEKVKAKPKPREHFFI